VANESLLLQLTGANDATVFTDLSATPKTLTAHGAIKTVTTITDPFGNSDGVAYFNGTDAYLTSSESADYAFDADFTIEGWIEIDGTGNSYARIIENEHGGVSGGWLTAISDTGKLFFYAGGIAVAISSDSLIPSNTWAHWAITREAGTVRMFLGGALQSQTASISTAFTSQKLSIGYPIISSGEPFFSGYMSNIRLTKGVALYTGSFTPPSARFAGPVPLLLSSFTISQLVSSTEPAAITVPIVQLVESTAPVTISTPITESVKSTAPATIRITLSQSIKGGVKLLSQFFIKQSIRSTAPDKTAIIPVKESAQSTAPSKSSVNLSSEVISTAPVLLRMLINSVVKSTTPAKALVTLKKQVIASTAAFGAQVKSNLSVKSIPAFSSKVHSQKISVTSVAAGLGGSITTQLKVVSKSLFSGIGRVVLSKMTVSSRQAGSGKANTSASAMSTSAGSGLVKLTMSVTSVLNSALARVTYAMNTATAELTRYTNFDFLAIIRLATDYYGVKKDGLYKLIGNTDNGTAISAEIITHENDYGTSKVKNVHCVYIDSKDPSYCQPIVDGILSVEQPSTFSGAKTPLGRGKVGEQWQFKIRNKDGGRLRLTSIDALVDTKSRRI
jgi:hypothetical protein